MQIDSHHHFWNYDPVQYEWIGPSMSALALDFLPAQLNNEIQRTGIDGVVSVQARQTVELIADLSPREQADVMGATACRAYDL